MAGKYESDVESGSLWNYEYYKQVPAASPTDFLPNIYLPDCFLCLTIYHYALLYNFTHYLHPPGYILEFKV